MESEDVVRGRRSIRRYRPDPVPEDVIRQILDEARWAPSWTNTQCWDVYVVTGEPLQRIKSASVGRFENAAPFTPDIPMPGPTWPERYAERTRRMMEKRIPAAAASEKSTAPDPAFSMPALYGAPCLLVFTVDKALATEYACFDTGLMVQNVCLAAYAHGLGTCIMAVAVRHPDIVKADLPDVGDRLLVVGVTLGYPDLGAPVNGFERERVALSESVTFVS